MAKKVENVLMGLVLPIIMGCLLPFLHRCIDIKNMGVSDSSFSVGDTISLILLQLVFAYLLCRVIIYSLRHGHEMGIKPLVSGILVLCLGAVVHIIYGFPSFYVLISLFSYLYCLFYLSKE